MPRSILALAFSSSARAWAALSIWARTLLVSGGLAASMGSSRTSCSFDGGLEVYELETALLEDVVHAFLLVGSDGEFLNDVGVLPPDSGGAYAEAGARVIHGDDVLVVHFARPTGAAVGRGWWCRCGVGLLGHGEGARRRDAKVMAKRGLRVMSVPLGWRGGRGCSRAGCGVCQRLHGRRDGGGDILVDLFEEGFVGL